METVRVLYIECKKKCQAMVSSILSSCEDYEFEVVSITHVRNAIDELSNSKYDVILTAIAVGDAGGPDIAQKLNVIPEALPVIFLVEEDNVQLGKEMLSYGAQDYLSFQNMSRDLLKRSILYAVERQKLMQTIQDLSLRDDLTQLYNRRGFRQFAEQQIRIIDRNHQPASLIFVDLDNLKVTNDTYGHHEGDMAICDTAEVLKDILRASDVVGRVGGDEFIVLAPDTNDLAADKVVLRIRERLDQLNERDSIPYKLNASIGTITYDGKEEQHSLLRLQSMACEAMYTEKKGKKGTRERPKT